MTRVVTLVPWRAAGNARRTWCWDVTKPALEQMGYELFTGEPPFEEWARSHALNDAARKAGDWDVAIIGDADTIPEPDCISRAVTWVLSTGGAVRPHFERHMLTKEGSLLLSQRGRAFLQKSHFAKRWGGGGMMVLTREAWDAVGGFDERFVGWGHEDTAMTLRLLETVGWDRLPGDAWHLWHPTAENKPRPESVRLYREMLKQYAPLIREWAEDKGFGKRKPSEVF